MGALNTFYQKHKKPIITTLVLLCSILGITFSYLYGATNPDSAKYANLMALDYEAKQQSINFLRGYVKLDDKLDGKDKYQKNIEMQYKTIYKYSYYNSFLLSSSTKGEPASYTPTINKYSDGSDLFTIDISRLAMVRNYWDLSYMESIGLPLFRYPVKREHNDIMAKKPDINFGCYISSTQAYDIAIEMGLIEDGEKDEQLIIDAFNTIIDPDNDIYLTLSWSHIVSTFTINNIYVNSKKFLFLLDDSQKTGSFKKYGDYYQAFGYWDRNVIFTHAPNVFSFNSLLYFDIRNRYNNISLFINNVLDKNYAKEGSTIHFYTQSKDLVELSKNIDKAYLATGKGNLIYLLVAIVFFELLLLSQTSMVSLKGKRRSFSIIKFLMPAIPFLLLWLVVSIMMLLPSQLVFAYFTFNYIGNSVSLIFLAVVILSGFIWNAFGEDDEKII